MAFLILRQFLYISISSFRCCRELPFDGDPNYSGKLFLGGAKWWRNAVDWFEVQSHEKMLGPKFFFYKIGFWTVIFVCSVNKVINIQIVTHPYLACLLKNMPKVFHNDIAVLRHLGLSLWKIIYGRLTVLLNDEEMLSTDFSFKVRKKCKAEKKQFSQIWFLNSKNFFLLKKKLPISKKVTHPYLARLSKNVLEVGHVDIANFFGTTKMYF